MGDDTYLFQFHCGTIKTEAFQEVYKAIQGGFNSTVVRLKQALEQKVAKLPVGFNSTVVRLKLTRVNEALVHLTGFQFHCGTIKTYLSLSHP